MVGFWHYIVAGNLPPFEPAAVGRQGRPPRVHLWPSWQVVHQTNTCVVTPQRRSVDGCAA